VMVQSLNVESLRKASGMSKNRGRLDDLGRTASRRRRRVRLLWGLLDHSVSPSDIGWQRWRRVRSHMATCAATARVSPSDPPATLSTCFARSPDARTGSSGCARRGGATTAARRSNLAATAAAVPASRSCPVSGSAARALRPSPRKPHPGAAPRGPLPHRARSAPAPHPPLPPPSSAASPCSSRPIAR
jgi:hypothetical protein